jgi:hypothetical protein
MTLPGGSEHVQVATVRDHLDSAAGTELRQRPSVNAAASVAFGPRVSLQEELPCLSATFAAKLDTVMVLHAERRSVVVAIEWKTEAARRRDPSQHERQAVAALACLASPGPQWDALWSEQSWPYRHPALHGPSLQGPADVIIFILATPERAMIMGQERSRTFVVLRSDAGSDALWPTAEALVAAAGLAARMATGEDPCTLDSSFQRLDTFIDGKWRPRDRSSSTSTSTTPISGSEDEDGDGDTTASGGAGATPAGSDERDSASSAMARRSAASGGGGGASSLRSATTGGARGSTSGRRRGRRGESETCSRTSDSSGSDDDGDCAVKVTASGSRRRRLSFSGAGNDVPDDHVATYAVVATASSQRVYAAAAPDAATPAAEPASAATTAHVDEDW